MTVAFSIDNIVGKISTSTCSAVCVFKILYILQKWNKNKGLIFSVWFYLGERIELHCSASVSFFSFQEVLNLKCQNISFCTILRNWGGNVTMLTCAHGWNSWRHWLKTFGHSVLLRRVQSWRVVKLDWTMGIRPNLLRYSSLFKLCFWWRSKIIGCKC